MKRFVLFILVVVGITGAANALGDPVSSAFISPNPVEGKAELMFDEPLAENVSIIVKDLTGKTVYMDRPEIILGESRQIPLQIESLKKGIYILQVTAVSGKVKTLRFHKT
ncbi:MAG: T9SS type A sorting domain-containing protein [Crocinitomicaceae bacterium]|nr:T9SS type A sorting domain-containing protein [Crocinitomicaceae bacterium]